MPARPFAALLSIAMALVLVAPAAAQPAPQPAGAVAAPPEGPAQAWLVADLDTGQILGGREPYSAHAPASTIKALLAIVVLDQLAPNTAVRWPTCSAARRLRCRR
jgi:D-alanyl-D-alanine carboxypeptidase (penicillin-binding protein 5/6)